MCALTTLDKVIVVFLSSFTVGPWQANTYIVGAAETGRCVVIDPGVLAFDPVQRIVDEQGLQVEGVLLTHGHIDHVASAADVADLYEVPAWLHQADSELLTDPGLGLSELLAGPNEWGVTLAEPRRLELLNGGENISAAGLEFGVIHAPGHRPGCVMFQVPVVGYEGVDSVVFTGDVVFAGSIGRTDLPGGDPAAMVQTLSTVVLDLPDAAVLLPGHGEQTTMSHERVHNPYLQASFLRN